VLKELISFSTQAIDMATTEIEANGTFLPFGAILTTDDVFQLVVYTDPDKVEVDPRENATIIQKLIMQKYKDSKCRLVFIAFDGIAHLKTGDIDSINVRVSNKPANFHKLLTYPYKIVDNKVEMVNKENPIINNI
jgi:hypothetical protein